MKAIKKYLGMLFALAVTFTATAQTANKLSVGQVQLEPNTSTALPFSMDNTSEIVAMQFDLTVPQGVTLNTSSLTFSDRKADHKAVVKKTSSDTYTFMVYSPSNATIKGSEGEVFNIELSIDNSLSLGALSPLTLSSVVLSKRDGTNAMTDFENGYVQAVKYVTISADPCEHGHIDGLGIYVAGLPVSLTAVADETWHLLQWEDGSNDNPRTVTPQADMKVGATFSRDQFSLTVLSADAKMGTVSGSGVYDFETQVSVKATANTGYHFVQWSDGNKSATRTYVMGYANVTLTATFAPNQYTITVNSANSAMGTATGGGLFDFATIHEIAASPVAGYHFVEWSDGNTVNPRNITVAAKDETFTASFAPNKYTIAVSSSDAEMGSVTGAGTFDYKASIQIGAQPETGYRFLQWNDGNKSNPRTVVVPIGGASYVASFGPQEYNITVLSSSSAMGTVAGGGVYPFKSEATISATAVDGYHFVKWNDGNTVNPRTFTVGAEDLTFTATFAPNKYPINASSADAEMGSVTGSGSYDYKSNVTVEAVPNEGYHFVGWSDEVTVNPRTINVPLGGYSVTATFAPNEYTITVKSANNEYGSATGGGVYLFKTEHEISASAVEGYHFTQWGDGNKQNPRTIVVGAKNATYTASFAPNIYHIDALSADAEMGSADGSGDYEYKSKVTLNAAANTGYHFVKWADGVSTARREIVVPIGGGQYTAEFDYNEYNITVLSADEKMGSVAGSGLYKFKSEVEISATAIEGYHFVAWSDNEKANPRTVKVGAEDATYTATFAPNIYHIAAVSADAEMGSATGSGDYEYKSKVTLEAKANTGYHFTKWSDGVGTAKREVEVGLGDATYTAEFDLNEYNITVLSADEKMGTVAGSGLYKFKSEVEISATAIEGYHFVAWSDNEKANPRTVKVGAEDATYTATFAPNIYHIAAVSADAEMGVATGSGDYEYKSKVTLEAKANTGYHFTKWSDGVGTAKREVVVGLGDVTYTAEFDLNEYNITVLSADEKMGTVSGSGLYKFKSEVEISATAIEGYHFVAWSDNEKANPRTVKVGAEDATYTATFAPNIYHIAAVSADAEMGAATGSGDYEYKSKVTLEAKANTGYHFTKWSDGVGTAKREVEVGLGDATYTAEFDLNEYNITVLSADEKMGSVAGSGLYKFKSEVEISATAIEGYHFVAWSDNEKANPRTVKVGAEDATYTATFAPNIYHIAAVSADAEMGAATGSGDYEYKSKVTLEAKANTGYHFTKWSDGVGTAKREVEVGLGDATYTAEFDLNEYNITVLSADEKMGSVAGSGLYKFKSEVEISATAIEGYHFVAWSDNEKANPRTVKVGAEDATYTATFAPNIYHIAAVSADAEMGSATGSGDYEYKSKVTLEAKANTGYHFTKWSDGVGTAKREVVVGLGDATYTAEFDLNEYNITVLSADEKMGTVAGSGLYKFKSEVEISATAIEGYHFVAWSDNEKANPRTVKVGAEDATYTATFAPNIYHIAAVSADAEMGAATGSGDYEYKSKVTLEAKANTGYHFTKWSDGVGTAKREVEVGLGDATYTAEFDLNEYNITVLSADEKMGTVAGSGLYKFKSEVEISATAIEGYHFVAWSDNEKANPRTVKVGAEDATYTAIFAANIYMVTFVDWDGTELKTEEVEYGQSATAPKDPVRENFEFIGWDKEFSNVTEDLTVTALYEHNGPVAEESETTEVRVTVELNGDVLIEWPKVATAELYIIDIKKDGVLVFTLTFNAQGQLLTYNAAMPARNGNHRHAPAAEQAANGWKYTLKGLDAGSHYTYTMTAKLGDELLVTDSVEFDTAPQDDPTAIDQVIVPEGRKMLINGMLYIERNGHIYTVSGQEVK